MLTVYIPYNNPFPYMKSYRTTHSVPCQQVRDIASKRLQGGVGFGSPCCRDSTGHHAVKHILKLRGHHHKPL